MTMRILAIDIGNSNINIGLGSGTLEDTYRYTTDIHRSADEYHGLLKHLFEGVDTVIIASVVPQLNTTFKTFIQRYFAIDAVFVGPGVKSGVKIQTDNPKEVGADLVASAAGTIEKYADTAAIVDMGTATTFTALLKREITGVAITVGLDSGKDCLIGKAAQLLQFSFETPSAPLGKNTVDALNAGLLYGHAAQVEGMVGHIVGDRTDVPVIVTGGASRLIDGLLPSHYIFDEHLVLEGLMVIAKNHAKNTQRYG